MHAVKPVAHDVMKGVHPLPRGNGIWMDRAAIDQGSVKEDKRNPGHLFKDQTSHASVRQ
jgi:hypothetical protein